MKKIFFSLFAVAMISVSVAAQDSTESKKQDNKALKSAYRGGKKDRKEKMKQLNLSEDQKKEMKENREEFKTKIAALDKDQSLTVTQRNEKKAALKKEQKSSTQALLTPDQQAKMAAAKKDDREAEKQQAAKRMEDMKVKLGLNDEQVMQLKAVNISSHQKMTEIRNDKSLDEATKKQQMDALKKSNDEKRKTILTPEQEKKMNEMKQDHKPGRSKRAA